LVIWSYFMGAELKQGVVQWDDDAGGWRHPLLPRKGCIAHHPVVVWLNPSDQWCSRGGTRRNAVPPNILWGNAVPPDDIRTRGNGDIAAFPQAG